MSLEEKKKKDRKMKNRMALCDIKALKRLVAISLGGALAGFFNGLLGAGGGIIVVLALSYAIKGDGEARRSLYANALCVMLPLSLLTLLSYALRGGLPEGFLGADYLWVLVGGAIGGILGGVILGRLRASLTDSLFALLTVVSGVLMLR